MVYNTWDGEYSLNAYRTEDELETSTAAGFGSIFMNVVDQGSFAAYSYHKERQLSGDFRGPIDMAVDNFGHGAARRSHPGLRAAAQKREDLGGDEVFGRQLTKEEAEEMALKFDVQLRIPDKGVNEKALAWQIARRVERQRRQQNIYQAEINPVVELGVSLVASAADPVMWPLAAISGGTAPIARGAGFAARQTARFKHGAKVGALASVPEEALIGGLGIATGDDYTAVDAFIGVTFGSLLGGGFSVAGGAVRGTKRRIEHKRATAKSLADSVQRVMNGNDVSPGPAIYSEQSQYFDGLTAAVRRGDRKAVGELMDQMDELNPDQGARTNKERADNIKEVMALHNSTNRSVKGVREEIAKRYGEADAQTQNVNNQKDQRGTKASDERIIDTVTQRFQAAARQVRDDLAPKKDQTRQQRGDAENLGPQSQRQTTITDEIEQDVTRARQEIDEDGNTTVKQVMDEQIDMGNAVVEEVNTLVNAMRKAMSCAKSKGFPS